MKRVIKSKIFTFILGAIIFGSVGVIAANYAAKDISFIPKNTSWKKEDGTDITNVKDALDDLYKKDNIDNYDNKTYSQEGISIYDNRVIIVSGGYYIDNDNVTWVNLKLKFNKNLSGDNCWTLIYGLPNTNKELALTDINNKHTFKLNSKYASHQKSNISFMDFSQTSISSDEEIVLQFKY